MPESESKCTVTNCIHCSKNFCSCLFSHIGLSGLVVAYTILGGFLFYSIEVNQEQMIKLNMSQVRNETDIKFDNLLSNILINISGMKSDESFALFDNISNSIQKILNDHEKQLLEYALEKGWNGRYQLDDTDWSYAGSLLYSITVITTIGYGHVTPKTPMGRVVTIFYALFGIPLTILYLNNIGDFLAELFQLFYSHLCLPICRRISRQLSKRLANSRNNNNNKNDTNTNGSANVISQPDFNYSPNISIDIDSSLNPPLSQMNHSYTEPLISLINTKINCWNDLDQIYKKLEKSEETIIDSSQIKTPTPHIQKTKLDTAHFYNPVPPIVIISDGTHSNRNLHHHSHSRNTICDIEYTNEINDDDEDDESVPLTLTLAILVIYIVMGAFIFNLWDESQDYIKWSYFCFITLSTIGFGDIVPGTTINDDNPKEKLIVSILYVAIGLPVFAMCFKLMEDEIIKKAKSLARKIGIIKS